jgi:hypothetical protein
MTEPFSHQRGCYIRTMSTRILLGVKTEKRRNKKKKGHEPQGARSEDEL